MTMRLSSLGLAAAAAVLAPACQGFETDTRCQFRLDPSELWAESNYDLIISEPPPFVCPIPLVQFSTRLNYSTTAVAPHYRRPVGVYVWNIRNATNAIVADNGATFGALQSDGTYKLQVVGQYLAGTAGYQDVMNDKFFGSGSVEKDFGIYPAWTNALFPYKCCGATQAINFKPVAATSFDRVKVGKATTLRAFRTNTATASSTIRWYRNNVEVNPPSNNPWGISGTRSAFTHTYTAPGTYTWKVVTTYDFPVKTNTLTWTQVVDP